MSHPTAAGRAEALVLRLVRRCSHPRKSSITATAISQRPRYRAVFLSDVHLGVRASQVERLCRFLEGSSTESLYLVGDIVDFLALERTGRGYGPIAQLVVLVHRLARRGTRVIFIPGNHDAILRRHIGQVEGPLHHDIVHRDTRGRRLLVTHGDEADKVVTCHPRLTQLGSFLYDVALEVSRVLNFIGRHVGLPYWNFAGWVKRGVKRACTYIGDWENTMASRVQSHGLDGVICGHIHQPRIGEIQGRAYYNCGDWVEHASALVETWEGEFRIVNAPQLVAAVPAAITRMLRLRLAR